MARYGSVSLIVQSDGSNSFRYVSSFTDTVLSSVAF